ncbi:MAG: hypothetical protein K5793_06090 [Nitrosarchaeum sp.]|nr:hypothetical protein [Nitrosarchaeum sp.]
MSIARHHLHMPKTRVSIKWQILFSLISPLNVWAFYRIKKLRKYVLYVLVPSLAVSGIMFTAAYYEAMVLDPLEQDVSTEQTLSYMTPIEPQVGKFDAMPYPLISIATSVAFSSLSAYLVIKWSREWNETIK